MSVTDLTGTKWKFGEYLLADYSTAFSYAVNYDVDVYYDQKTAHYYNSTSLGLRISGGVRYGFPYNGSYFFMVDSDGATVVTADVLYNGNNTAPRIITTFQTNFESFILTINGGTDATNTTLIAWLEANAEQIIETTPTTITYNGSTIASLFGGQTATLKCGGMKMETDLVVEVAEPDPVLQEKTATENGEVTPDEGYDGLSKVTVNVPETIPDGYIKPSGTKSVTANGVHDVGSFANVNVSVPVGVFPSGTKEITENGTHDVTEFASVTVDVPAPVLTYYGGTVTITGGETLISFTINGISYQAVDGMTWSEWVESSYNTGGWFLSDGGVASGTDAVAYITNVTNADIIVSGRDYAASYSGSSGN